MKQLRLTPEELEKMKTIFRLINTGLILATVIALGAVAGLAQDTCVVAEVEAAQDRFDVEYKKGIKDVPARKEAIRLGKEFIEKYSTACSVAQIRVDWLKLNIPKKEEELRKYIEGLEKDALINRFNSGMTTKNWDEVYASGKDLLNRWADEFRDVELVLGSIGLDETAKSPSVTKWNDDTLRFAKASIADLEANKKFNQFGVNEFTYKTKENALGWMNYTIGYILYVDKKNKSEGLSYLYKASIANSETKSNPVIYQTIGGYYYDEVRKLAGEADAIAKSQNINDPEDVAKQKKANYNAKVGVLNGTAVAGIDAFNRAHKFAVSEPKKFKKEYAEAMRKQMQNLYDVRFGKLDGFDAFIVGMEQKPMPNPTQPVMPIIDPEPVNTTAPTTTTPPATTTTNGKPATKTPATKPAATPATKPVATKPSATIKKPVKKRGAR
jgi:hypothetical protein